MQLLLTLLITSCLTRNHCLSLMTGFFWSTYPGLDFIDVFFGCLRAKLLSDPVLPLDTLQRGGQALPESFSSPFVFPTFAPLLWNDYQDHYHVPNTKPWVQGWYLCIGRTDWEFYTVLHHRFGHSETSLGSLCPPHDLSSRSWQNTFLDTGPLKNES